MNITATQAKDIICEEYSEEFDVVEVSGWVDDGKYEFCTAIISDGTKYYRFCISRSGSNFTDWNYDWEDMDEITCCEVVQKEVITTIWERV